MMFKPACFPLGEFAKPLNLSVGEEYLPWCCLGQDCSLVYLISNNFVFLNIKLKEDPK